MSMNTKRIKKFRRFMEFLVNHKIHNLVKNMTVEEIEDLIQSVYPYHNSEDNKKRACHSLTQAAVCVWSANKEYELQKGSKEEQENVRKFIKSTKH